MTSIDILKQQFIEALKKDENFRYMIIGLLSEGIATKTEINQIIEEVRLLREDFNRRFEEHSREIEVLWAEVRNLRADMQKGFERMEGLISVIGGRWGVRAEVAFRNAMMELVEEARGG